MTNRTSALCVALGLAMAVSAALSMPATARRGVKLIDKATRKFDHKAHDQSVASKGRGKTAKQPACDGVCHTPKGTGWAKTGSKEHDRCLGCHEFTSSRTQLNSGKFNWCFSCHEGGSRMPASASRQKDIAKSHVALYSHKSHVRPGARSGKQCEACHGEFGEATPTKGPGVLAAGHDYCGACHQAVAEPGMNECTGCHADATGERGKLGTVAPRPANPYAVDARFDHEAHARANRVGTKGRECLACHDNIAGASTPSAVPLPTMKGCYDRCHNGKDGFDATGTTCTRCHAPPARQRKGGPR